MLCVIIWMAVVTGPISRRLLAVAPRSKPFHPLPFRVNASGGFCKAMPSTTHNIMYLLARTFLQNLCGCSGRNSYELKLQVYDANKIFYFLSTAHYCVSFTMKILLNRLNNHINSFQAKLLFD